jgi:hypothetical protein
MTVIPLRTGAPILDPQLPPGRRHGRLWVTDEPLAEPELYQTCVTRFAESGAWPVLIPHDERFAWNGEDWLDRECLDSAGHLVGGIDPAAVLNDWWLEPCCDGTCLEPFGARFPGLARAARARPDVLAEAGTFGWARASVGGRRLGLVPAPRPADVPAILGWSGMINSTQDVAAISAVLRSWEDRFGATLVTLGFDALELAVAAPPTTVNRALRLAAEHRAFCRYNFTQQPGDLRAFAAGLVKVPIWRFWWD